MHAGIYLGSFNKGPLVNRFCQEVKSSGVFG